MVKIYASAGLKPPNDDENRENEVNGHGFIQYEFKATIEAAEKVCHDVSSGSIDESTNTLDYNDVKFYSIRVDQFETHGFTYAQMIVAGNVNVQASSLAEYQCILRSGRNTLSRRELLITENVHQNAQFPRFERDCCGHQTRRLRWHGSGRGRCSFYPRFSRSCLNGKHRNERVRFYLLGAKDGCGWRPDCKSCALGINDDCSWCQGFDGTCANPPCRGYCASASERGASTWPASKRLHAKCPQVVKQTIVARRLHAMTAEPSADVVGAQLKAKKVCALRAIRMDLSLQKAPATVSSLAFVVSGLSPVTLMGATKRAQCTTDTRTHAKRVREKQTAAIAKRAL